MPFLSFFSKLLASLNAGCTVAALFLLLGNSGTIPWLPPVLAFSGVGVVLLLALLLPFAWQLRERRKKIHSDRVHALLTYVIRYGIAFNLASFGWKKILGQQFVVPPEIASRPVNQLSGE